MKRTSFAGLLLVLLSFLLAGCGGGGGGSAGSSNNSSASGGLGDPNGSNPGIPQASNNAVTKIAVLPTGQSLVAGTTLTFSALASDQSGNSVFVAADKWAWTVSDNSLATLTPTGDHMTLTAKTAGSVTVTAKDTGSGITGTATLTITNASVSAPGSAIVYHNDFKSGAGSEWSNTKTDTTPGTAQHAKTPFLGQFGTDKVTLSLTNLPAHASATVEFDLFIINSMDGNTPGFTDLWDLRVQGGPILLHTTFSNITPTFAVQSGFPNQFYQSYPDTFPGGNHPYQTGATEVNTLGYLFANSQGDLLKQDSVYHLKYTFAHAADALKLDFSGVDTQPVVDESWGITNVTVSLAP